MNAEHEHQTSPTDGGETTGPGVAGSTDAPPPPPPAGAEQAPPPPPPQAATQGGLTVRHAVSVILALFPGLGHIYNGLYQRGIVLFMLAIGSIFLATEEGLMGMVVAFVWLFNIIDAYRQASLIEDGHGPDLGLHDAPKPPATGQLGLLAGAGLFVIGFLALLDYTLGYDIDRVWEFWPLGLLAAGTWLMIGAYRQWRRSRTDAAAAASN